MTLAAAERRFEQELEIFRQEVESIAQFWFAAQAMPEAARSSRRVLAALNRHALLWNTINAGLQAAAVIGLGRVFDQDSRHNVDRLLRIAQADRFIFSREALGVRKSRLSPNAAEWLDEYLKDVYLPRARDLRELRRRVARQRRVYEAQVRDIRRQVFAHREYSDREEIDGLFRQANRRDIERLIVFLLQLHEVLWQLYHNGRRPVFRRVPYSSRSIARRRLDTPLGRPIHERIMAETRAVLREVATATAG